MSKVQYRKPLTGPAPSAVRRQADDGGAAAAEGTGRDDDDAILAAIARVREAHEAIDLAHRDLNDAIGGALRLRVTWREIGAAMGTSASAAHQRYRPSHGRR